MLVLRLIFVAIVAMGLTAGPNSCQPCPDPSQIFCS